MSFVFHVVTDPVVAWLVVIWLSGNGSLQWHVWDLVVVIGLPGYDGSLVKIKGGRRRRSLPLQPAAFHGLSLAMGPYFSDHRK